MSAQSKLLVIVGITGLQGSSVYRHFKDEPGWRIRGITRNPSKHAHLKADNVELVAADLDDVDSLKKAFEGATAIYSVTDFWQFPTQPSVLAQAEKEGRMPNEIAMGLEIEQGKNIIRAAETQLATLDRLVVSTLSESPKWSNGEIKHHFHFDGKAAYTKYLKEAHPRLAAKTSYLQMGIYTSNWRMAPVFAPRKQADGSFIIPSHIPGGMEKTPWATPQKDTGLFVKALVLNNPAGTAMIGVAEWLSLDEYCKTWGKVHGVETTPSYADYDAQVAAGLPQWMALEISESGIYSAKFGHTGGDPEYKEPGELGVDVSKLTTVETAIREEDWSSVM